MHPKYFMFFYKLAPVYFHYKSNTTNMFTHISFGYLLLLPTILYIRIEQKQKRTIYLCIFLYVASLLAVLSQNKGFKHHVFLSHVSASIIFIHLLFYFLKNLNFNSIKLKDIILFYFLITIFSSSFLVYQHHLHSYSDKTVNNRELNKIVLLNNTYAKNAYFVVLSPNFFPFSRIEHFSNSKNALRYFNLWFLPGFHKDQLGNKNIYINKIDNMSELELEFFNNTIEDIIKKKPAIIYVDKVDNISGFHNGNFNIIAYYLQNKEFNNLFSSYKHYGTVYFDDFDVFINTQ